MEYDGGAVNLEQSTTAAFNTHGYQITYLSLPNCNNQNNSAIKNWKISASIFRINNERIF